MTIYSLDVLLFLFGTSLLLRNTDLSRGRSGGLVFLSLSEFSTFSCDSHSQKLQLLFLAWEKQHLHECFWREILEKHRLWSLYQVPSARSCDPVGSCSNLRNSMTSLAQVRGDGMMSLVRMEITGLGFGCQRWCPEGGSVRKSRPPSSNCHTFSSHQRAAP